jgi:hypothetical protein
MNVDNDMNDYMHVIGSEGLDSRLIYHSVTSLDEDLAGDHDDEESVACGA